MRDRAPGATGSIGSAGAESNPRNTAHSTTVITPRK